MPANQYPVLDSPPPEDGPMSNIEIQITQHAHDRARERHGEEIDLAKFKPTGRTRDGLRYWSDDQGRGLMVCERASRDLSWISLTVVTALDAYSKDGARRFKDRPYKEGAVSSAAKEAHAHILGARLVRDQYQGATTCTRLVALLEECPGVSLRDAAQVLDVDMGALGRIAGRMRIRGEARKSKNGRWYLTGK